MSREPEENEEISARKVWHSTLEGWWQQLTGAAVLALILWLGDRLMVSIVAGIGFFAVTTVIRGVSRERRRRSLQSKKSDRALPPPAAPTVPTDETARLLASKSSIQREKALAEISKQLDSDPLSLSDSEAKRIAIIACNRNYHYEERERGVDLLRRGGFHELIVDRLLTEWVNAWDTPTSFKRCMARLVTDRAVLVKVLEHINSNDMMQEHTDEEAIKLIFEEIKPLLESSSVTDDDRGWIKAAATLFNQDDVARALAASYLEIAIESATATRIDDSLFRCSINVTWRPASPPARVSHVVVDWTVRSTRSYRMYYPVDTPFDLSARTQQAVYVFDVDADHIEDPFRIKATIGDEQWRSLAATVVTTVPRTETPSESKGPTAVLGLMPEEIQKTIKSAPPLQRADIAKNYRGIKIRWQGSLSTVSHSEIGTQLCLRDAAGKQSSDLKYRLFPMIIALNISEPNQYPGLRLLPQGGLISVTGTIVEVDERTVLVDEDELEFTVGPAPFLRATVADRDNGLPKHFERSGKPVDSYWIQVEVDFNPSAPIQIASVGLQWRDDTAVGEPADPVGHFKPAVEDRETPFDLDRSAAYKFTFPVSPSARSRGQGRVVVKAANRVECSEWFDMNPTKPVFSGPAS